MGAALIAVLVLPAVARAQVSASPDPLDFGDVLVGVAATEVVTLSNDGIVAQSIDGCAISGASEYAVLACPSSVPAGGTAEVPIEFAPSATGSRAGTLTVAYGLGSSVEVTLAGVGVAPELTVSPTSLAFGDQRVDTSSAEQDVVLGNAGTAALTLISVSIPGANAEDYVLTGAAGGMVLQPGDSVLLGVTFAPLAAGAQDATLTIETDSPVEPTSADVALTGTGTEARIAVSPGSLDLGRVVVGTTSSGAVSIENPGDATLTVSDLALAATSAGAIAIASAPATPFEIAPGGAELVDLVCAPGATGSVADTLTVSSDADTGDASPEVGIGCVGVKPDIAVSETSIDLGDVALGDTATALVTIANADQATTSDLTVTLTLGGADASDFALDAGSFVLAPGASRDVTVTFAPGARGARAAVLEVASDDQETPLLEVELAGTGRAPDLTLVSAAAIDFGDVRLGDSSAPSTVTLRNDGNADLSVDAATLGGAAAADFVLSGALPPLVLAPAATASFEVACAPSEVGARIATLTVSSDDPDGGPAVIDLACTGTEALLVASPSPVSFPETRVGEAADEIVLTLENGGDADLEITAIVPPTSSVFPVLTPPPPLPVVLAPGESLGLGLGFEPTASTDYTDSVVIESDAPGDDVAVAVLGPGRIAEIAAMPASHDFGAVRVDRDPVTAQVTLRNTGTARFVIGGVSLGTGEHFTLVDAPTDPVVLEPAPAGPGGSGEVVTFTVEALPTVLGAVADSISVQTDIPGGAVLLLPLDAVGVVPDLMVSNPIVDFGVHDVQAEEPELRTVTVVNSGSASLDVSAIRLEDTGGGPYQGDAFALVAGAPALVPPGDGLEVAIAYQPTVESGGDAALLRLESDAASGTSVAVPLSGRGADRHIEVTSGLRVDFPPTYRNPAEPAVAVVEVSNTGEAPLAIRMALTEGAFADSFTLPFGAPGLVAPGATEPVTVAFRPRLASAQPLEAALTIVNDDDDRPMVRVDLVGLGVLPEIAVSPASIDFGRVAVNVPHRVPAVVRLANMNQTRPFTVRELRVVGADGSALESVFRIRGPVTPVELDALADLELEVELSAAEAGIHEGAVEIYVDSDPEPVSVVSLRAEADPVRVRGGGCSSTGAGGGGWAVALVWALWLGRRRLRRRRLSWAAGAVLVAAAATAPARAQPTRDLDIDTFRLDPSVRSDLITVVSPLTGPAGSLAVSLGLQHVIGSLQVESTADEMSYAPVATRLGAQLVASYGLVDWAELGLSMPVFSQRGDAPAFGGVDAVDGTAVGDLGVHAKLSLFERGPLAVGTAAAVTLPTATDDAFAGASGPTARLRALGSLRLGRVIGGIDAGLRWRPQASLGDVEQGSEVSVGIGAATALRPSLSLIAELRGAVGLEGEASAGTSPFELMGGARWEAGGGFALLAGVGRGLLPGIGAPDLRSFAVLSYAVGDGGARGAAPAVVDHDEDGIGAADRCPHEAEDFDGFEDEDGCPDLDHDGDRIVDRVDRCPEEPEDHDGFEDGDGCPDDDNDGDGVPDARDRCPDERGAASNDGCEDLDVDRDGILDLVDQCPDEPETINGVDDDDGCPDAGETLVLATAERIETYVPIRFRGKSARLHPSSYNILGQVAATLRAHREILVLEVKVHVHRRGGGDRALSVKRAEAVRAWLVDWGVEPERLRAVGEGSASPLRPGGSADINDRVELVIVEAR